MLNRGHFYTCFKHSTGILENNTNAIKHRSFLLSSYLCGGIPKHCYVNISSTVHSCVYHVCGEVCVRTCMFEFQIMKCEFIKIRNLFPVWVLTFHFVWGKNYLMFSSELHVAGLLLRKLPNILLLCLIPQEIAGKTSLCYYAQPFLGSGDSNLGLLLCNKHFTCCVYFKIWNWFFQSSYQQSLIQMWSEFEVL